ncbi:MAG: SemiSWEET transporter [Williamsia sp.]|nr:SemiSWEET transporter [Williamsia sp.]
MTHFIAVSTQVIGLVAGFLTSVSMLPQLIKTLKEKKAGDVSFFMLIVLISGVSLWIYYGVLKDDKPIIITNCISVVLNVAVASLKLKYKS